MTVAAEAVELGQLQGFHDLAHGEDDFRKAVLDGLSQPQKRIPCKYLYDERGSRLFDEICALEEYYLTRTEVALLEQYCSEIAQLVGPNVSLVEFGSGSSLKVRIILDALWAPAAYIPVDISRDHLIESARVLAEGYPDVAVIPVCADYTRAFSLPDGASGEPRVGFFPGSTIGNLTPTEATVFLKKAWAALGAGGGFLVGVDLKKAARVLNAAYNDSRGVTAAFSLNLLARVNRELGADFDLGAFVHTARYNTEKGCVEMHLSSRSRQAVTVRGVRFTFEEGERIHTEDSYKYTVGEFHALARSAGWEPARTWIDRNRLFSVHYLEAV